MSKKRKLRPYPYQPFYINGWECFFDPCSYDMWTVRPRGKRSYGGDNYFINRSDAEKWMTENDAPVLEGMNQ